MSPGWLVGVLSVVLSAPPPMVRRPTRESISDVAQASARLAEQGKYEDAAAMVRTARERFVAARADANELSALDGLISTFDARAQWAKDAGKDRKAARKLLLMLLDPEGPRLAPARADDPRVAALLDTLRANDPRAKQFFSARAVRVVVQGDGLSTPLAESLAEAVVPPLRALGFAASAKEGDETLVLTVTRGKELANLRGDGEGPLGALHETSVSCELKVDATWTQGQQKVINFDLSRRGLGFSDIPDNCARGRIKEVAAIVAARLVRRWDTDYAP